MLTTPLAEIHENSTKNTGTPTWLIKGILPPKGLVVLYGPPGVGKTFLMLDMVLAMASGTPWPLRKNESLEVARKRGEAANLISPLAHVIYWIGEGRENAEARVLSWIDVHVPKDVQADAIKDIRMSFVDGYVTNLLLEGRSGPGRQQAVQVNSGGLKQLSKAFGDYHDPETKHRTPVLVVDTLSATHPAMDENDTRDAGQVMENCRRLAEELDGLVILVHHSGKGRGLGPRGHSRMLGDPDTILNVTRPRLSDPNLLKMTIEKQRMSYAGKDMLFLLSQPTPEKDSPSTSDEAPQKRFRPPVLLPYDGSAKDLRQARMRKNSVLTRREKKTIEVLGALRGYLPENTSHFQKNAFVRKMRTKWSEASIYEHLKLLQKKYKVINNDQPEGRATEGDAGAQLYRLDKSWTEEKLAAKIVDDKTKALQASNSITPEGPSD